MPEQKHSLRSVVVEFGKPFRLGPGERVVGAERMTDNRGNPEGEDVRHWRRLLIVAEKDRSDG